VSNNGNRFPNGLELGSCTTLGLELVSSLTKQLKGVITMTTGDITEFWLEFCA
jgi:two-component sensor histidine kinase